MKLIVIGSSSKGNCYILEGEHHKLILEAGIKFDEVKKALEFKLDYVAGCLVTHSHKDHLGHVGNFLINGIQVYGSKGTMGELNNHNINYVKSKQTFYVGEFKILAFDSIHDTEEPLNFLIESSLTGERLLFITDSAYCKYKFKDIDYLLVECNFKESIIQKNVEDKKIPEFIAQRIRETHMEFETTKRLILNYPGVKKVILIHLSDKNSDPGLFEEELTFHANCPVHVAKVGDEYAL